MTIARKRYIGSRAITLLPGTLVATCWKKRVLVGVDFIHRSRIRCLAWIASAVMLAMPSCAVLAESVYVANSGNSTLSKFNASGQFISTLWNPSNEFYFHRPSALAFDSQGNLYVANSGNSTLSKFNASGQFISTL